MSRKKAFALDPLEVVNRFIAAANRHDADGVAACVHREFESLQPIHPVRNFRGSAQLLANWKAIFRNEPGFRLTMLRSAVDDDTVWVELHGAGQEAEVAGIFIIGVENGLIRWARVYSELVEPAPEPVVEAVATGTDDAVASPDDAQEGEDAGGERRLRLVEDAEEPEADEEEGVEPETAESEAAEEEAADSEVAAETAEGEVAEVEAAEEEVAEAEVAEAEVAEPEVAEAVVVEDEVAEDEVAEDDAGQSEASEDEAADLAEAAMDTNAGPPEAEDEAVETAEAEVLAESTPPDVEDEASETAETAVEAEPVPPEAQDEGSETAETAAETESEPPDTDDEAGAADQAATEDEPEGEEADESELDLASPTQADRDAHIIAEATKPPAKPHKDHPRGRRRKGRRRK